MFGCVCAVSEAAQGKGATWLLSATGCRPLVRGTEICVCADRVGSGNGFLFQSRDGFPPRHIRRRVETLYREIMWHSLQSVPYSDNRSPILFHKVGNGLVFAGWGVSGCAATIVRVKTPITPPATRSAEPALASPRTTASRLGAEGWLIATGVAVAGAVLRILMLALFAHANDDATRGLLTKWDARYYLAIAEHGYFPDDLAVDGPVHHLSLIHI